MRHDYHQFSRAQGQLYSRGINGNIKFCSTRDMFAFILDPENQHNIQQAFVHDMAVTPWITLTKKCISMPKQRFM